MTEGRYVRAAIGAITMGLLLGLMRIPETALILAAGLAGLLLYRQG